MGKGCQTCLLLAIPKWQFSNVLLLLENIDDEICYFLDKIWQNQLGFDVEKSAEQILEKCHRDIAPYFTMWPLGGQQSNSDIGVLR